MKKPNYMLMLLTYWLSSFTLAVAGYYLLYWIMPEHEVFHKLSWFFSACYYHMLHPISFIAIPCFFYGIIATLFSRTFSRKKIGIQILLCFLIMFCTVLFSSPFGGALVYYYDMRAGYFPEHWMNIIIEKGAVSGTFLGWAVVAGCFPYSLLGMIVCFFLTRIVSNKFFRPTFQ